MRWALLKMIYGKRSPLGRQLAHVLRTKGQWWERGCRLCFFLCAGRVETHVRGGVDELFRNVKLCVMWEPSVTPKNIP